MIRQARTLGSTRTAGAVSGRVAFGLAALLAAAACTIAPATPAFGGRSSGGDDHTRAAATPTPTPTSEATPEATLDQSEAQTDSGPRPTPPRTLAEIAKDRPLNLEAVSKDGKTIKIINDSPAPPGGGLQSEQLPLPVPALGDDDGDKKNEEETREYWQQKYLEKVRQINRLKGEIADLDREIPELQSKFYRWDDPAYRDGVIKPKLDKAMERRDTAREELAAAEAELPKILDAARRDGAQPGWFRGLDQAGTTGR